MDNEHTQDFSLGSDDTVSGPDAKLHLDSVVKRYGHSEAVRSVSLEVRDGEFLTLLGPSGSGKTTLLRLIAGFVSLTSGAIRLDGRDISNLAPGPRGIGMVFQNYALFPHLTTYENITYPLKVRKWKKSDRRRRVEEVLSLLGLEGYGERYPHQLSGGQQQRVAVGRALAFRPALLLMDEPLGALDRELRVRMAGELRRIHEEIGNTVLYVTHDREEALTLSDRIVILRDGRIQAAGTPQDLYARPETAFVASFFGGHNLVPCDGPVEMINPRTVRVSCMGQSMNVLRSPSLDTSSREVDLSIPGDAIDIKDSTAPAGDIDGVVHSAAYMGNQIQVMCDVGLTDKSRVLRLRVDIPGGDRTPPVPGTRVRLRVRQEMVVAVNRSALPDVYQLSE